MIGSPILVFDGLNHIDGQGELVGKHLVENGFDFLG
jgi:hypothetical protein